MEKAEETVTRLERWRLQNGYTYEGLGEALEVSTQSAFRYCLPSDHKNFRRPAKHIGQRLSRLTQGLIHSDNACDLLPFKEAA